MDGLQYVVLATLGATIGEVVLWCVVIAITVCELAVQAAGIRLVFAMARDNNLPASSMLARVSPRFKTPVVPAIIMGIVAIVILVININQPQIFSVITSIAIIMISPICCAASGSPPPAFSLGRFGLPVNILAVLWGAAMSLNLAWPRSAVYNATAPPLVPAVGRVPSSSGSSVAAASPTTGSSSASAPA